MLHVLAKRDTLCDNDHWIRNKVHAIANKFTEFTLSRQELYFPDVEVGNHWATCDVVILTSPDCFDKQLTQQGQIYPYVCPFWTSTKFGQSYTRKNVFNFGSKIGGKIGQVT